MRKSNPRNPRGRFGVLREHSASRSVREQEARAEIDEALARMEAEEAEARELDRKLLEEGKRYSGLGFRPLDEENDPFGELGIVAVDKEEDDDLDLPTRDEIPYRWWDDYQE